MVADDEIRLYAGKVLRMYPDGALNVICGISRGMTLALLILYC
jgi:hypothetical protein